MMSWTQALFFITFHRFYNNNNLAKKKQKLNILILMKIRLTTFTFHKVIFLLF